MSYSLQLFSGKNPLYTPEIFDKSSDAIVKAIHLGNRFFFDQKFADLHINATWIKVTDIATNEVIHEKPTEFYRRKAN